MRLVFAGTPAVAVPALEALLASRHEVVAVLTRPDAARGRSSKLVPSEVGAFARDAGLPVLKPAHPREEDFVQALTQLAPDACPVVAYGALVPQRVLDIPRYGWINLHFSLLPRWRGAAPVQRALMAGDAETGATTFRLVRELDAGPVYRTLEESIGELDTSAELLDRLAHRGAELLVQTLQDVEAGVAPTAQGEEGITLAPKLTVDQTRVSWQQPAASIAALVRGANPNPGAWTTLEGQRFKLWLARPAQLTADVEALEPGTLHATRKQVFVGTGDGVLELLRVQAFGKKEMAAADWARGMHQLPSGFDTDTEEQAR